MVAAGDSVYLTSGYDGRVICLSADSGQSRWQFTAGAGVERAPMFYAGKLYFGCDDGYAYCLNAATGELVWKFQAAPAVRCFLSYGKMISVWPVRTDVLVDNDIAYFAAGIFPHEGTFLYAVDANTGELVWRNGTQCENGHQLSLAPGGYLYMTGIDVWVPKDFRGFSKPYYGSPTPFRRQDGVFVNGFGTSIEEDPQRPKIERSIFWPLIGVEKDGIRYGGGSAWKVAGEEQAREAVWNHDIPDRWTDFDSGVGVRQKRDILFRYDPDLSTIVYAGGTIFHSAFDSDPAKGVGSGIYARDAKDGKLLWSVDIPERANQLIVANGRLLVGTRRGTVHCFATDGATIHGEQIESISDSLFPANESLEKAADYILADSKHSAGYAVVLDCRTGQLAYELAKRSDLYVVAVFADETAAGLARDQYAEAGMHLSRVVTCTAKPGTPLPFPSYFADLIVSEEAVLGGEFPSNTDELLRLQKPIRGVALIGGEQKQSAIVKWTAKTKQSDWQLVEKDDQTWARRVRPRLPDGGGWTHMYGDAGNTGCSHDSALKGPLGVTWYGPPHIEQPGTHTALIVDGILVVPQPNSLEACDQYTGRRLWRLDAGSIGVSIATSNKHVYAKVAHVLAQIDLYTGKEKASYLSAFGKEHPWNWFAVGPEGKTVFGAAGGGVFATEMESGKGNVLWALAGPEVEEAEKLNGLMAMSGNRIFVLGGKSTDAQRQDCIEQMRAFMKTQTKELLEEFESQVKDRDIRQLIAIDAKTGKIVYRRGVDVSNCGGTWLRAKGRNYGSKRHYNPYVNTGMYVHDGVVVISSEGRSDKGWGMWNSDSYDARATTAYDAEDGKLMWYKFTNHRTRPVIINDTIHAEPWAFDLRTGAKQTRKHPITGEDADWAWCRADKQCGIFSASSNFLFGRNKGFGYHDLVKDDGLYTFWHSRSNCRVDHVSGGGLMIKPPQAIYCQCQWSLPFTVAMGQVSTRPAAAPTFAQPGSTLPVKHLRLDFGASGDRRDKDGNLWLASNRPVNHKLLIGYDLQAILHEGGADVRRAAHFTSIADAEAPFIFASAIRGLKRCLLPISRSQDGQGRYLVRIGFVALPGDVPGQRVFNVQLNGNEVLKDFDIAKEAGGADVAIWREFKVELATDLMLELVPQSKQLSEQDLPLISAIEIKRLEVSTLGMKLPDLPFWLEKRTPEKTLDIQLGNLTAELFRGRLEIECPKGLSVTPATISLDLNSPSRKSVTVTVKSSADLLPGNHILVAKLVAANGETRLKQTFTVEYLGDRTRKILYGGSHCLRQEPLHQLWSKQVRPNRQHENLGAKTGFQKLNDGGAATSYIWFHIPTELRAKPLTARVRLTKAPVAPMFSTQAGSVTIKRLTGPPWPNLNEFKYPELPKTTGEPAKLNPSNTQGDWVEANVPGAIDATDANPNVYLAIEAPKDSAGDWFRSHHAPNVSNRPIMIVDYLPEAVE
jgi:outer membrane protein assembly factor BamB